MSSLDLEKDILSLSPEKRAKLAARLWESLSRAPESEHAIAWGEEAEARLKAYDEGRITSKSADDVLAYRGKNSA